MGWVCLKSLTALCRVGIVAILTGIRWVCHRNHGQGGSQADTQLKNTKQRIRTHMALSRPPSPGDRLIKHAGSPYYPR